MEDDATIEALRQLIGAAIYRVRHRSGAWESLSPELRAEYARLGDAALIAYVNIARPHTLGEVYEYAEALEERTSQEAE